MELLKWNYQTQEQTFLIKNYYLILTFSVRFAVCLTGVLTYSNKYLSQHESNTVENLMLREQNTWGAAYLKEKNASLFNV